MSAADPTTTGTTTRSLQSHLIERSTGAAGDRRGSRKLLLPYVTAGITPDWLDLVEAVIDAGADAVEIGIPFSDPAMDGTTIQEASVVALERGITPAGALTELRTREFAAPLLAMTYYNLVFRYGHERFAADLAAAGGWGTILPDLPLEHAADWLAAAEGEGIENVLLVAPVTSDDRLTTIVETVERTGGFVYVVSTMGTTGARDAVDDAAGVLARRVKAVTNAPAIVGFGVSNPETAIAASRESDGVIVASALMRRMLDGATVDDAHAFVAELRRALDDEYAS